MARVSVVIPHLNGIEILDGCLNALGHQSFSDFETILVDNGSTDTSVTFVRERFPWVQILELGSNHGFAGGCNAGIEASSGEYIVLLNDDTEADHRFLEALVMGLDRFPEAGFGASKVILMDPPNTIDSAGDRYSYKTGVPYSLCRMEPADSSDCNELSWVFGASAAAAIYRRTMLDDIGLLDEDFFYIMEDIDLDFRAQLAGYRCLYNPSAVVLHRRGISIQDTSQPVRAIMLRNLIWTAGKNLPASLLLVCAAHATIRSVRWLGWLVKRRLMGHRDHPPGYFGRGGHAKEIFRAIWTVPRKRRKVQKLRRVPTSYLRHLLQTPRSLITEGAEPA